MEINLIDVTKNIEILTILQKKLETENEGVFYNVSDPENEMFSLECYAIYKRKNIIGFVSILLYEKNELDDAFIEIYRFNIFKDFRNKGFGKIAITSLLTNFSQRGFSEFCIEAINNSEGFWGTIFEEEFEVITADRYSSKYCFKKA